MRELHFFLDGKRRYVPDPTVNWDHPIHIHIQMAIETYDWPPVRADGGLVAKNPIRKRETQYNGVRTWRLK